MSDGEGGNKKGVGAPTKYKPEYCKQVRKLCLLGADDQEIADFFEVSLATINNWKLQFPEFLESIRSGKEVADMNVADSLYNRAVGFDYEEVKEEEGESDTGGSFRKVTVTKKKALGDVRAQQMWLLNRQRKRWVDKQHVDHTTDGEKITTNQPLQVIIKDMSKKNDPSAD